MRYFLYSLIIATFAILQVAHAKTTASSGYVGYFMPLETDKGSSANNKITIFISKLDDKSIEGYSIVAGNQRKFSGKVSGKRYLAKEPGTDPYDGAFSFDIAAKKLSGTWHPYNKKLPSKKFNLSYKTFAYQPTASVGSDLELSKLTSTRKLDSGDVEGLYLTELVILHGELMARHGYSFKDKAVRAIFDPLDWYMPVKMNVLADFTEIERHNIALLKRYKTYVEQHGEDFGR